VRPELVRARYERRNGHANQPFVEEKKSSRTLPGQLPPSIVSPATSPSSITFDAIAGILSTENAIQDRPPAHATPKTLPD
jgi:hypothetical protein